MQMWVHSDPVVRAFLWETLSSHSFYALIHWVFPLFVSVYTRRYGWTVTLVCATEIMELLLHIFIPETTPMRGENMFNMILHDLGMGICAAAVGKAYAHVMSAPRRPFETMTLDKAPLENAAALGTVSVRWQGLSLVIVSAVSLAANNLPSQISRSDAIFAWRLQWGLGEVWTAAPMFMVLEAALVALVLVWELYVPHQLEDLWDGRWMRAIAYWLVFLAYVEVLALLTLTPIPIYLMVWTAIGATAGVLGGALVAQAVRDARSGYQAIEQ